MNTEFDSLGRAAPNKSLSGLIDLARKKSTANRVALAATLSELFNEQGTTLSAAERSLMFDIMRGMVRECEISVRKTLASFLASSSEAPTDLIKTLANDDIEVAYPVLTESGVLKDMDLIEIIRNCTFQHQLAVAVRNDLSEAVSEVLVETDSDHVIQALLGNEMARISPACILMLADKSKEVKCLQEPLLRRCDISPETAKRMFMWVSVSLRNYIVDRFDIDEAELDSLMERAALMELEKVNEHAREECAVLDDIDAIDEGNASIPEMMVHALQTGEVPVFIALFSKMSGLRRNLIMRFLIEPGGEGLAVACKGVGISRTFFSTLFTLTRKAVPGQGADAGAEPKSLQQVLTFYNAIEESECRKLLQRWQLDSGYLNALRHFENRLSA